MTSRESAANMGKKLSLAEKLRDKLAAEPEKFAAKLLEKVVIKSKAPLGWKKSGLRISKCVARRSRIC